MINVIQAHEPHFGLEELTKHVAFFLLICALVTINAYKVWVWFKIRKLLKYAEGEA